jgi:hypothetical protein
MIRQFIWLEPALIFALILANGFFAAAEIAIIATRKSRIDALLEKGVKAAAAVARLKNDPDRFLATVQIGVTVVSSLASAIGGAAAIGYLEPKIEALPIPIIARWAEIIAIRLADFLPVVGTRRAGSEVAGAPFFRAHRLPHRSAHRFPFSDQLAFGEGSNGVEQRRALDFRRQRKRRSQLYLGR